MPKFSVYFALGLSQHEMDFVDVSTDYDTPVYVDPYAIEIRDDIWCATASEYIGTFFMEVLTALRSNDDARAIQLMSHFREPSETFLGVSSFAPSGRGIGSVQAAQLIEAIKHSQAFKTGLLEDLSEMALYVEGVDRDKISDLTTNIIRRLLVDYTQEQCALFAVPVSRYSSPPMWNNDKKLWESQYVDLPYVDDKPVLLVPKYIVRRKLTLDSQEFYNKQITDFLVEEHYRANDSLVHTIRKKKAKGVVEERKVVYKGEVRKHHPKSKTLIADMVRDNPKLLEVFKEMAQRFSNLVTTFTDDQPSINEVCKTLSAALPNIPPGNKHAEDYHRFVLGAFTALFFPNLIQPHKEWEIHDGRKRIDIVYTNAGDSGFFAQRRDGKNTHANLVIVECKNYSDDIANAELDQLLGRFDDNRGRFGILVCRSIDNNDLLMQRCRDMSSRSTGFIIVLTDNDILEMLNAKENLRDKRIEEILHLKFRELLQ